MQGERVEKKEKISTASTFAVHQAGTWSNMSYDQLPVCCGLNLQYYPSSPAQQKPGRKPLAQPCWHCYRCSTARRRLLPEQLHPVLLGAREEGMLGNSVQYEYHAHRSQQTNCHCRLQYLLIYRHPAMLPTVEKSQKQSCSSWPPSRTVLEDCSTGCSRRPVFKYSL